MYGDYGLSADRNIVHLVCNLDQYLPSIYGCHIENTQISFPGSGKGGSIIYYNRYVVILI